MCKVLTVVFDYLLIFSKYTAQKHLESTAQLCVCLGATVGWIGSSPQIHVYPDLRMWDFIWK